MKTMRREIYTKQCSDRSKEYNWNFGAMFFPSSKAFWQISSRPGFLSYTLGVIKKTNLSKTLLQKRFNKSKIYEKWRNCVFLSGTNTNSGQNFKLSKFVRMRPQGMKTFLRLFRAEKFKDGWWAKNI